VFVSPGVGSCTCATASAAGGLVGLYLDGETGSWSYSAGYDCTCDETNDCASSHVHGGKFIIFGK